MKGERKGDREGMRKQHYNSTPRKYLAMMMYISRMWISLPNILAITGGGEVEKKKNVKKTHNLEPENNMALSPMTVSQPQCSAMHGLATFSHVNQCEKTTANDREHFAVFVRIRRHSLA